MWWFWAKKTSILDRFLQFEFWDKGEKVKSEIVKLWNGRGELPYVYQICLDYVIRMTCWSFLQDVWVWLRVGKIKVQFFLYKCARAPTPYAYLYSNTLNMQRLVWMPSYHWRVWTKPEKKKKKLSLNLLGSSPMLLATTLTPLVAKSTKFVSPNSA